MLKSTPPSFFNNCRRVLETQRNKLRKMTTKNTERVFYATDGELEQPDDETVSLLACEQTASATGSSVLEQRINAYNSRAMRKIEHKYSMISRIYDEMSTIMHSQSEDICHLARKVDAADADVERGVGELDIRRQTEKKSVALRTALFLLGLALTVIIVLALLR